MTRTRGLFSLMWLACLSGLSVSAELIYNNDFEHGIGPEWSDNRRTTTPADLCIRCTTFLGPFQNDTLIFALPDLPQHSYLKLEFDLYVMRSWDGNVSSYGGPDIFHVREFRRSVDFETTFSNNYMYGGFSQAFPDAYPGGVHPSQSGAVEVQTLGYRFDNWIFGLMREDAVYRMTFRFPHVDPTLIMLFEARNLSLEDEIWGLDNVAVSIEPIPEPASILLAGSGLLLVYYCRSRRRLRSAPYS